MSVPHTVKSLLGSVLGQGAFEETRRRIRRWQANYQARSFAPVRCAEYDGGRAAFWEKNGYLVLPGWISEAEVDATNDLVDSLWSNPATRQDLVTDIFIGQKKEIRVHFADAPSEARAVPYKLNDLYLNFESVRKIVLERRLARLIAHLLDGAPLACNTLNFEYGSQQEFHTDSIYMTPPRESYLVASWIALEDCAPAAGPLQYYPGSHKIPPFRFSSGNITAIGSEMENYRSYMNAQVAQRGLKSETFPAKKGDVFLWHSQLFHGGSKIENPALTRRSLVTHYFRAQDLPGPHGSEGQGRFFLRRPPQAV